MSTVILFLHFLNIIIIINITSECLVTQHDSIVRPFLKLCLFHLLFEQTGVMLLVSAVVGEPYGE